MNNLESVLAGVAIAAAFVLAGCACLEAPFEAGDILAAMHDPSQAGGE